VNIRDASNMVSGWGEAVEKLLNEGDANGRLLVNSFASESLVYLTWDIQGREGPSVARAAESPGATERAVSEVRRADDLGRR
jgi:hypothetical protein